MPIALAHRLSRRTRPGSQEGHPLSFVRPDGKSPGHRALREGLPAGGRSTPWSSPRSTREDVKYKTLREAIIDEVIKEGAASRSSSTRPSTSHPTRPAVSSSVGRWATPRAFLTGRKIIVDTYGEAGAATTAAAPSPGKIRRRSIARRPTTPATSPRTWHWPPKLAPLLRGVQLAYAIGRGAAGLHPRHRDFRDRHHQRRRHRAAHPRALRLPPGARSSASSTCCVRSIARPPLTATSAAARRTSPGSRPPRRPLSPPTRGRSNRSSPATATPLPLPPRSLPRSRSLSPPRSCARSRFPPGLRQLQQLHQRLVA